MDVNKILKMKQFKAIDLEEENGEVLIFGELKDAEKSCPHCNTLAIKPHQYHKRKVRTVPFDMKPTYLIFIHTAYLCPSCGRRFLEKIDFLEKCQRKTVKYVKYVYELAKKQDLTRVAELEKLEWRTVNEIFLKGGEKEGNRTKKPSRHW
jgi:transposase